MIPVLWFCLIALMIAAYVVLDGFDLGAGILHLFGARNDAERRQLMKSIGPVWDGNEVWLLAAGGTLYFAFPALYSAAFSGFYLALMIVLWLLILRGVSIELRSHIESPLWRSFWDLVFGGSSALLALLFGVALGNVVRGVPLDSSGFFFLPLWTDLQPGREAGIIDWYTLLVGAASFFALATHGCAWVAFKTVGDLEKRARVFGGRCWWGAVLFTGVITFFSFRIQPHIAEQFAAYPAGYAFPALALAGLTGMRITFRRGQDLGAFLSSCVYLAGMLTSAAFGAFPYLLPSNTSPQDSLTIANAAAAESGLILGLWWWTPGMLLAIGYTVFVYRRLGGKIKPDEL
jgi:cytochrome d ubiquinol oxidase subunit II